MDLISEPFTEETVTDLDFTFTNDEKLGLTLRTADTYEIAKGATHAFITMKEPAGEIMINLQRALWWSERKRIVRHPIVAPPTPSNEPTKTTPAAEFAQDWFDGSEVA